jgi:hypothetical protein
VFDLSRLNFADELAQCQRFYEKSFPYGTAPVQNVGNNNGAATYTYTSNVSEAWNINLAFKAVKRAIPTITTYNPAAANANWNTGLAYSTTSISDGSAILGGAVTTSNGPDFIHWSLDAEI